VTGAQPASLGTVFSQWGRIGLTGFGGPPAHIALLRELVVAQHAWLTPEEFEDALSACNLLPGPASTQLAIFCAHRVAGRRGALVGGLAFAAPAVAIVLALSVLFLARSPPDWVRGAGSGAGAAVPAVAVGAALALLLPSRRAAAAVGPGRLVRWPAYVALGIAASALVGPYVVFVLAGCGVAELALADGTRAAGPASIAPVGLVWVAVKVGLLSYGGGFVIVPLMQGDSVHTYHWMSQTQFLNAVALGQVTPGPVVATIAAVGYAAAGAGGALVASAIAFAPSFCFVLAGARRFAELRTSRHARAFLGGAGPAAIGAILGAAIPLTGALREWWQFAILALAAVSLLIARRGVVVTLVCAGALGTVAALAGAALP
jgi:chromate transporter